MGSERQLLELAPGVGTDASRPRGPRAPLHAVDPAVRDYFEQTVEYWDQIYAGSSFINWHLAHRRQLVIEAVQGFSHGLPLRVLDLGCGSGVLTRDLLRMGHSVAALDCSENMLRALLRNLDPSLKPRFLGAAIGSAGDVCLRGETFDVVICVGVIQYQRHPEFVFREIGRLLKPGGICVFTIPNQLSFHHVLDPWCLLRYLYRAVAHRRGKGESLFESFRAAFNRPAYTDRVYEKRYFRRDIPGLVGAEPLIVRDTVSFGYGPFTFWNRSLFPNRFSIVLSKAFTKLAHLPVFSSLSVFANRWVIVLERTYSSEPAASLAARHFTTEPPTPGTVCRKLRYR